MISDQFCTLLKISRNIFHTKEIKFLRITTFIYAGLLSFSRRFMIFDSCASRQKYQNNKQLNKKKYNQVVHVCYSTSGASYFILRQPSVPLWSYWMCCGFPSVCFLNNLFGDECNEYVFTLSIYSHTKIVYAHLNRQTRLCQYGTFQWSFEYVRDLYESCVYARYLLWKEYKPKIFMSIWNWCLSIGIHVYV